MESLEQVKRKVKLRPYDEVKDMPFVLSSFIKPAFEAKNCFEGATRKEFNDVMVPHFKEKLQSLKCIIACNAFDDDQIYGFILYSPKGFVYWIYVKKLLRRLKIGTYLFKSAFGYKDDYKIQYPFETHVVDKLKKQFPNLNLNVNKILMW